MASASTLQYPRPAGGIDGVDYYYSTSSFPIRSSSFSQNFNNSLATSSQSPALASSSSQASEATGFRRASSSVNDGSVYAARTASNHAKLHKRRASLPQQPRLDTTFARGDEAGSTSFPPINSPKSSTSKSSSKDKLKHSLSLKKTPQPKDDSDSIDLDKTTEENEEILGLGISTPSRTTSETNFSPTAVLNTHKRSVSYASLQSFGSSSFKPTAPFAIPEQSPPSPEMTQHSTENASYTSLVVDESDYSAEAYYGLAREEDNDVFPPLSQTTTMGQYPPQQIPSPNSSRSQSRMASPSQTNLSQYTAATSITRPRRSTNQSLDTLATATSSVKNFMSPSRRRSNSARVASTNSPSMEPVTRQESIQAARKAFREREKEEEDKFEIKQQKRARRNSKPKWSQNLHKPASHLSMHDPRRARRVSEPKPLTQPQLFPPPSFLAHEYETSTQPATPPIPIDGPRANATPLSIKPPLFVKVSEPAPHRTSYPLAATMTDKSAGASGRPARSSSVARMKNRYMRLLTWLKIRLLKVGKSKSRFQGRATVGAAVASR